MPLFGGQFRRARERPRLSNDIQRTVDQYLPQVARNFEKEISRHGRYPGLDRLEWDHTMGDQNHISCTMKKPLVTSLDFFPLNMRHQKFYYDDFLCLPRWTG